jgi:uncharacterized iron-regulated membrane protein
MITILIHFRKGTRCMIRFLHLWTGLIFGTILVVLGLTGTALAWIDELDSLLNPTLLHAPAPAGTRAGAALRPSAAAVQAAHDVLARDARYGKPTMLALPERAGDVYVAWYRPDNAPSASRWQLAVSRQVMLDPATLTVTGERNWGEAGLSRPLLMPTLFHVHRYLVAGEVGKTVIAVTGVSLLLLALSGIVLWWPRMTRSAIWAALTVRHGGNWPRFNFQLHRAAGFFAAPVLLMLAFSGIYFNMPAWITPVVKAVAHVTPPAKPVNRSAVGGGVSIADATAAAQARFPDARVSRISMPSKAGAPYEVRLRQAGELRKGPGATRVTIDSGDGAVLRVIDPVRAEGGDAFLSWLFPLHSGEAFGIAGRAFISVFGLMPLMFMVTGLVIWLKLRRKARKPTAAATSVPELQPLRVRRAG